MKSLKKYYSVSDLRLRNRTGDIKMMGKMIKKKVNKELKSIENNSEASDEVKAIAEDIREEINADVIDTAKLMSLLDSLEKAKQSSEKA